MRAEGTMKKLLLILLFISVIAGRNSFAQDAAPEEAAPAAESGEYAAEEAYVYPVIKPEVSLVGGYRYVHLNDSSRAEEFEYLHDSVTLAGEARLFSFPHRFHLDLDIKNKKDYFGDVSYAYEDIILFRAINRTLWHNLDNIILRGVDAPSPGISISDNSALYGVETGITNVFLRFKTHDFPFHVYADGGLVVRDGTQQLRSLLGSGYFNDIVRSSQGRGVDWRTKTLTVGANSHLGPVEVDISHGEKRFDVGGANVFFDPYGAATSGLTVVRNADGFPHNLISELKGSSNTVKIHTSYTGKLVASATFSKIESENRESGAKADYLVGAGEVSWIASPKIAFFVKYRHRDRDLDTPDSIAFSNVCSPLNNPTHTYACIIRPAISAVTDTVSATGRFRVTSGITVRAEFSYDNIDREDAEKWFLPGSTTKMTASLSTDVRVARNAKLMAKYIHQFVDNPATNIEPNHSDEGRVSFAWVPFPALSTLVSYRIVNEKRNDLQFVEQDPVSGSVLVAGSPDSRDAFRHRFLGSVTYLLLKDLSLTASYSYIHNKVKEDLAYTDLSDNLLFDHRVPESDTTNNYSFDVNYMPSNNISLAAGVNYTVSSGGFIPSDVNLVQPVSIASFSELKTRETGYSASAEYRFKNGFSAGLRYRYSVFDDVLNNPYDDLNDGSAHIVLLTLSKKW
jgi:predicted porin